MRVCPRCRSIYATKVQWCGIDNAALVEQPNDPLVGREIERYRIMESLGVGGMGCVYRANHAFIEREYAIKVLFGDFAGDPKFRERFRREAKSISQIRHPNIVTVEDFGTTPEGLTFLAMEMVHGRTLERAVMDEAPFSPVRAAQIVRQIVAGLGAAHSLGFVHRDVKPSNIMLTETNDMELVKILDFGAVSMRSVPVDQRLTSVGHIIGTPTYMAPEQSQDPNVGPPADLYAVGVILYELLTASPPFVGKGRAEVLIKHIMEEAPKAPPSRGLERIVAALLKKHPEQRPQAASEVIRMIDMLGLDLAIVSDPPRGSAQITMTTAEIPGRRLFRPDIRTDAVRADPSELLTPQSDLDVLGYDTFPALTGDDPADWGHWSHDGGTDPLPYIDDLGNDAMTTRRSHLEQEFGGVTMPAEGPEFSATSPADTGPEFDEGTLPNEPSAMRDDGPTQVDFALPPDFNPPRISSEDILTGDLSYDLSLIPPDLPEVRDTPDLPRGGGYLDTAKTLSDSDFVMLGGGARVPDPAASEEPTGDLGPPVTLELPMRDDYTEDSEESMSVRARVIPVHDSSLRRRAVLAPPRFWTLALIALLLVVSVVIVSVVLWIGYTRAEAPVIIDGDAQSQAITRP